MHVRSPDFTDLIANIKNVAILTDDMDGGYVLVWRAPGLYEAHTLAVPSARGRPMMRLLQEGFAFMFTATDAVEIVAQVPEGNEQAEGWCKLAGFRNTFKRRKCFSLMGDRVDLQYKSLAYGDWVVRGANNPLLGEAFHDQLTEAGGHIDHAVDPVHDAWVGATLAGCINHNPTKAINLYNRWAVVAAYAPISVLNLTPVTLDIGTAILQLRGDAVEILRVNHAVA